MPASKNFVISIAGLAVILGTALGLAGGVLGGIMVAGDSTPHIYNAVYRAVELAVINRTDDKAELQGQIEDIGKARNNALRLFADPARILSAINLDDLREAVNLADAFESIAEDIRRVLDPFGSDAVTTLGLMEGGLVDNPQIRAAMYLTVKEAAVKHFKANEMHEKLKSLFSGVEPLFQKPFDLGLFSDGHDWYEANCWDTETAKKSEENTCAKSDFPKRFQEYYGVEATEPSVWVLGFFHGRVTKGNLEHADLLRTTLLSIFVEATAL